MDPPNDKFSLKMNVIQTPNRFLTTAQREYLERQLKKQLSDNLYQRIKIMLLTDDGMSQAEICRQLSCSRATVRHWSMIMKAGQIEQWKENTIGRPKCVSESYLNRLRSLVNSSPKDHGYAFHRWTAGWLSQHLAKELGIQLSTRHVSRLLKQMGLSTRSSAMTTRYQDHKSTDSGIVINNLDDIPEKSSVLGIATSMLIWDSDQAGLDHFFEQR